MSVSYGPVPSHCSAHAQQPRACEGPPGQACLRTEAARRGARQMMTALRSTMLLKIPYTRVPTAMLTETSLPASGRSALR
eukprot:scaffold842_cov357-Prasinococcus_capsulatus_cf.AAC.7